MPDRRPAPGWPRSAPDLSRADAGLGCSSPFQPGGARNPVPDSWRDCKGWDGGIRGIRDERSHDIPHFMTSIALNLFLHKRFASGRLLYEATIPSSGRFLMKQCACLTYILQSIKIHGWSKLFFSRHMTQVISIVLPEELVADDADSALVCRIERSFRNIRFIHFRTER